MCIPFKGDASCLLIRRVLGPPGDREKLRLGGREVEDRLVVVGGGEGEDDERETERGRCAER